MATGAQLLDGGHPARLLPRRRPRRKRRELGSGQGVQHSRVKTDTVLKVDCDTYVSNGLLGLNPVADKAGEIKAFRYGDYRAAADENEIHINGCVLAKKAVLEAVNFYDERLQQYGWDDTNFYDRLMAADTMALNITRRNALGKTLITHVWHPHSELSQDGRVSSSCENRCAINRLERREPWATQERSEYWKVSDMPNNGDTGGEYITFAKYQGGDLPSVQATLGEVGALLKAYCESVLRRGEMLRRDGWITGTIRRRSWRRTMSALGDRTTATTV